jgi:hypothetical protein
MTPVFGLGADTKTGLDTHTRRLHTLAVASCQSLSPLNRCQSSNSGDKKTDPSNPGFPPITCGNDKKTDPSCPKAPVGHPPSRPGFPPITSGNEWWRRPWQKTPSGRKKRFCLARLMVRQERVSRGNHRGEPQGDGRLSADEAKEGPQRMTKAP